MKKEYVRLYNGAKKLSRNTLIEAIKKNNWLAYRQIKEKQEDFCVDDLKKYDKEKLTKIYRIIIAELIRKNQINT